MAGEKERGTLARLTSFFEEDFRIAEEVLVEGTVRVGGEPRRTVPKSAPKKTLFHHNRPDTTQKGLPFTSNRRVPQWNLFMWRSERRPSDRVVGVPGFLGRPLQ
jgi:hypothetical protein